MAKDKWIQDIHMKKGALTESAKKAGVSNSKFIQEHLHSKGKSGKRARFAKLLESFHKK